MSKPKKAANTTSIICSYNDKPVSIVPNSPYSPECQAFMVEVHSYGDTGYPKENLSDDEKAFIKDFPYSFIDNKYVIKLRYTKPDVMNVLVQWLYPIKDWPNPFYPGYPEKDYLNVKSAHILLHKKTNELFIFIWEPSQCFWLSTNKTAYSAQPFEISQNFSYIGVVKCMNGLEEVSLWPYA